MGPNSGGGRKNKADAAKVSSARGRFSNCAFPGNSKAKRGGKGRGGGRGGGGGRGAGNAAPSEGGDGGGGRGRGGGRPSDAAVVKKLSERVSSGATSGVVVKNQAVALGGDGGNRDPLRGVDVASLDEISIAEGDWQRVFRLLKDLGLFEGSSSGPIDEGGTSGDPDPGTDEKNPRADERMATVTTTTPPRNRPSNSPLDRRPPATAKAEASDRSVSGSSSPTLSAKAPTTAASQDTHPTRPANVAAAPTATAAVLAYLTEVLAFPEMDAARALSNTSGDDLGEALDYLCLHTDEAALKKYFCRGAGTRNDARGGVKGKGKGSAGPGGERKSPAGLAPSGSGAVPAGIEVASSADWKVENRVLTLVRMGFHRDEAVAALTGGRGGGCPPSGEVLGHDTLERLLESLCPLPRRDRSRDRSSGDFSAASASACRKEEASVLSAIFEDGAFRAYGDENAGGGVRWEVDTSLEFDGGGISEHSTVTILFREDSRYPHEAPLVLVTNESLPPGLARRLTEGANAQAAELVGPDPFVYQLVGWLRGASREFQAAFLRDAKKREERLAAEKKLRAASARDKSRASKGSRGVLQQQQQQQQPEAKTEEEAGWRLAYLQGLNGGLDPEQARKSADMASGRSVASSTSPLTVSRGTKKAKAATSSSATTATSSDDDCRQKAQQSTPPENAARKLRLALVAEGREPGEVSSEAVGVFSDGSGNGVVAVAAGGDGYRATPYLHEVMQVLEETKECQPWLEAEEAKDLPLPPIAHATERAMETQRNRRGHHAKKCPSQEEEQEHRGGAMEGGRESDARTMTIMVVQVKLVIPRHMTMAKG
ncbi:unnamed protein product [Ascophyllum nodosum]